MVLWEYKITIIWSLWNTPLFQLARYFSKTIMRILMDLNRLSDQDRLKLLKEGQIVEMKVHFDMLQSLWLPIPKLSELQKDIRLLSDKSMVCPWLEIENWVIGNSFTNSIVKELSYIGWWRNFSTKSLWPNNQRYSLKVGWVSFNIVQKILHQTRFMWKEQELEHLPF